MPAWGKGWTSRRTTHAPSAGHAAVEDAWVLADGDLGLRAKQGDRLHVVRNDSIPPAPLGDCDSRK
jgi:hypothetical protein